MSEVPVVSPDPRYDDNRDGRLQRTLIWVGIVAGIVFTVAVIFFSGLALGRATGDHFGWHRSGQYGQTSQGGCPMMGGPGGMGGPGMMRPPAAQPE